MDDSALQVCLLHDSDQMAAMIGSADQTRREAVLNTAIEVWRDQPGDREPAAVALLRLATAFCKCKDYSRGMELLGLLVDYAREEKNQEILTASLGTMAVMLMETGELAEARKVFEEILAGATASHDSESVTRSLLNLGIIDARENHSDAAIARFSKALELAESTGDERMAQAARRSLAIAAQEADPAVCPRCHGETWVYAPGYGLQVCPQCKGSGKA